MEDEIKVKIVKNPDIGQQLEVQTAAKTFYCSKPVTEVEDDWFAKATAEIEVLLPDDLKEKVMAAIAEYERAVTITEAA